MKVCVGVLGNVFIKQAKIIQILNGEISRCKKLVNAWFM